VQEKIRKLEEGILNHERLTAIYESNIENEEKLKSDVTNLKVCSICKQEVGENHKHKISSDANEKITFSKRKLLESEEIKEKNTKKIGELRKNLNILRVKANELDIDEVKLINANEKKEQIKRLSKSQEEATNELRKINERLHKIKVDFSGLKDIEEKYDEARLGLQELSFADMDVDSEIAGKQREFNRLSIEIKAKARDVEESEIEMKKIIVVEEEKIKILMRKETEEQKLYEKNQEFHEERTSLQDQQKTIETDIIGLQHTIRNLEDKINHKKIRKAEYTAQADSLREELSEFGPAELIKAPTDQIKERLQKAQFRISRLGNVNMRALEVFDQVQEQVELIKQKVETIQSEEEKIKSIIAEIDKKKKKSFLHTLEAVNEYFTRNFSQLSRKGSVFLELENKKDPFAGGLNILIKVSRGRYFDITSLSGGEKTLVALSLIFAIQEFKPYCFYVFDEIDAALDKHNSELLAALIKKYMTTGQYIIVTHNDTLITEATNLYGVSMQENISKVISLKV